MGSAEPIEPMLTRPLGRTSNLQTESDACFCIISVFEEYESARSNSVSTIEEIFETHQLSKQEKDLPFPKSVYVLCFYKFLERFSYHGIRTVYLVYLATIYEEVFLFDNSTLENSY